jgi:hypothetical protein
MWGGTCKKPITAPKFDCGMGHTTGKGAPATSASSRTQKTEIISLDVVSPSFESSNSEPSPYDARLDLTASYSEVLQPIQGEKVENIDPKERYRVLLSSKQIPMADSVDVFNTILDSDVPTYGVVPSSIQTSNLASLVAMDIPAPSNFHLSVAQELINRKLSENWTIRSIANYRKALDRERKTSISALFAPDHTKTLLEALDNLYPESLASVLLSIPVKVTPPNDRG